MRRTSLFLIVTVVSLLSLTAVVVAGFYVLTSPSTQYPSDVNRWGNMWNGMMGGMMGNYTGQSQVQSSAGPLFGVAFVVLVAVAIIGVSGLIYFFAFPEIKNIQPPRPGLDKGTGSVTASAVTTTQPLKAAISPYDSVVKTLTASERKVIEVLSSHDGKHLQKYIRSEAGLSRLQTHRILARLAERGIVSLEKTGNTNTVLVADWLK